MPALLTEQCLVLSARVDACSGSETPITMDEATAYSRAPELQFKELYSLLQDDVLLRAHQVFVEGRPCGEVFSKRPPPGRMETDPFVPFVLLMTTICTQIVDTVRNRKFEVALNRPKWIKVELVDYIDSVHFESTDCKDRISRFIVEVAHMYPPPSTVTV